MTEASNRTIGAGIFLIDSGGQYQDGTTDVTRTLCIGKPTPEMRDRFTRVLKGHIAIATANFPKGTSGAQIDAFARRALWEAGLDFDHGTGHGVGSYLSVHEGPQRISKLGTTALLPGMILSNEPGYYKSGAWGIRIENLVVVEPRKIAGAEHEMLGFETITLVPIALAARRCETHEQARDRLARRLSPAGAQDIVAAGRARRANLARAGDAGDRKNAQALSDHALSAERARWFARTRRGDHLPLRRRPASSLARPGFRPTPSRALCGR